MKRLKEQNWLLWIVIVLGLISIPFSCIGHYQANKARFPSAPDWSHWFK